MTLPLTPYQQAFVDAYNTGIRGQTQLQNQAVYDLTQVYGSVETALQKGVAPMSVVNTVYGADMTGTAADTTGMVLSSSGVYENHPTSYYSRKNPQPGTHGTPISPEMKGSTAEDLDNGAPVVPVATPEGVEDPFAGLAETIASQVAAVMSGFVAPFDQALADIFGGVPLGQQAYEPDTFADRSLHGGAVNNFGNRVANILGLGPYKVGPF